MIHSDWQKIPGSLNGISTGDSGIWGVNKAGNIFKLNTDGNSWTKITGTMAQVSSGASVWGVSRAGEIYKYLGDNKWWLMRGSAAYIDVSNNDNVWQLTKGQDIFRWTGITWKKVAGNLSQISVGESGVWGVNSANSIFYRQGTYGDTDTDGTAWTKVSGNLKWISSGTDMVVGVDKANNIYYREGITADTPTGTKWIKVPGSLKQIDVNKNEVVGIDSGSSVYRSPVGRK